MGIYLGQLPPAEIARLKAELAETLIANFCYPRFFDHRTESLQMRPVDRKKRQEVWLYLSSVDFTAWSRIDLTSSDFQHQIERLFIQFVQRNRSFFGDQGRRRMSDIRMLISSSAATVTQGLRNHLTGQKQGSPPFGSPRPVVSWAALSISNKAEPGWEQIANTTMLLQQQLQELRGEAKTAAVNEPRPVQAAASSTGGSGSATPRRMVRPQPVGASAAQKVSVDVDSLARQKTTATPLVNPYPQPAAMPQTAARVDPLASPAAAASVSSPTTAATTRRLPPQYQQAPQASQTQQAPQAEQRAVSDGRRQSGVLESPSDGRQAAPVARRSDALRLPIEAQAPATPVAPAAPVSPAAIAAANSAIAPLKTGNSVKESGLSFTDTSPSAVVSSASSLHARSIAQTAAPGQSSNALAPGSAAGSRDMLSVGEDDVAIFEQMRHQLVIWLRIEAIKAGLETSDQGPAQLLEMLRQQAHFDETRLQVVSTLLNLANQVVKTGLVSVLDYKQALMFHLMHTRN